MAKGKEMTVGEMIWALSMFPPETRLLVDGYESGYDNPLRPCCKSVVEEAYASTYCGDYNTAEGEAGAFSAVIISRDTYLPLDDK